MSEEGLEQCLEADSVQVPCPLIGVYHFHGGLSIYCFIELDILNYSKLV